MEKPTCWKSTLLNPLLNEEKAIISDIAGTTRDFIEDEIHIEGVTFRFIDTAGIREARDKIEKIGVERTKQKMREASLILYLFDLKEESLEGACNDGVWEWIAEDDKTKIKFNYSEPTGGWWQEFEIANLDGDNFEVIVFDYVEGKEDPIGNGVIINFTKLDQ